MPGVPRSLADRGAPRGGDRRRRGARRSAHRVGGPRHDGRSRRGRRRDRCRRPGVAGRGGRRWRSTRRRRPGGRVSTRRARCSWWRWSPPSASCSSRTPSSRAAGRGRTRGTDASPRSRTGWRPRSSPPSGSSSASATPAPRPSVRRSSSEAAATAPLVVPEMFSRAVYAWGLTTIVAAGIAVVAAVDWLRRREDFRRRAEDGFVAAGFEGLPATRVREIGTAMWVARVKQHVVAIAVTLALTGAVLALAALEAALPQAVGRAPWDLPRWFVLTASTPAPPAGQRLGTRARDARARRRGDPARAAGPRRGPAEHHPPRGERGVGRRRLLAARCPPVRPAAVLPVRGAAPRRSHPVPPRRGTVGRALRSQPGQPDLLRHPGARRSGSAATPPGSVC